MRKQDLKDGMVVENREGERFIVMNNGTCFSGIKGYYTVDNLTDELTHPKYDTLSIYKVFKGRTSYLESILKYPGSLIWEREPEAKEYTVSQLENMLGYPIKIVKES